MRLTEAEREARAFVVDAAALLREPGSRRRVHASGVLQGLAVSGSAVEEGAAVEIDALLESVSEGILVTAAVRAPWRGSCSRCLEPASGTLEAEVCELYSDDGAEEAYPLPAELLDLAPLVRDACILELPLAPLCGATCEGLCPQCGVNRNTAHCACVSAADPRWAALAALNEPSRTTNEKDA